MADSASPGPVPVFGGLARGDREWFGLQLEIRVHCFEFDDPAAELVKVLPGRFHPGRPRGPAAGAGNGEGGLAASYTRIKMQGEGQPEDECGLQAVRDLSDQLEVLGENLRLLAGADSAFAAVLQGFADQE
jgi:hypothetical protein